MDTVDLNRRFGLLGTLAFSVSPLGGPVARLRMGDDEATVALRGGQVLSWKAKGRERLWLSSVARLDAPRPARGGIPVCWPWFGPHPLDPGKPMHGFARTRLWDVGGREANDGRVSLTVSYETDGADLALWPYEAEARLTVTLSAGALALSLATENTGLVPLVLTSALHTYFSVDDIARVRVEGLAGRTYIDKVAAGARATEVGTVTIDREVDRVYQGDTSAITLIDEARGGQVEIRSEGSRSAVLWNPWTEKTARLGDMGAADAFRRMLCIETANAGDDVVRIEPAQVHTLAARYRIA